MSLALVSFFGGINLALGVVNVIAGNALIGVVSLAAAAFCIAVAAHIMRSARHG